MVIKKPIQVEMVSAVPFSSAGACRAIKPENIGESATTISPQKIRIEMNNIGCSVNRKGEKAQHIPDNASAIMASLFAPIVEDSNPATVHDIAPAATTTNDRRDTGSVACIALL